MVRRRIEQRAYSVGTTAGWVMVVQSLYCGRCTVVWVIVVYSRILGGESDLLQEGSI